MIKNLTVYKSAICVTDRKQQKSFLGANYYIFSLKFHSKLHHVSVCSTYPDCPFAQILSHMLWEAKQR